MSAINRDPAKILQVKNLVTGFHTGQEKPLVAVDGVSFDVYKGRTLGIVGESGSGKSVTALSILRLLSSPPVEYMGGEILFAGKNLLTLAEKEMRSIRGHKISMIFQEPMTSLNPVFTVGQQIAEVLDLHQRHLSRKERRQRSIEFLKLVGIPLPEKRYDEYPHQLSGGMRQRVMIAMALVCHPEILIADEPTTALDVTIQAQILELMMKLQQELGMGMILITHDLGVVAETCHDVAVMYCGKIVECAPVQQLFTSPRHPYTHGLLSSIPKSIPKNSATQYQQRGRLSTIAGMVPSLAELPPGCRFQNRCPKATGLCRQGEDMGMGTGLGMGQRLTLQEVGEKHFVSCFHPHSGEEKN